MLPGRKGGESIMRKLALHFLVAIIAIQTFTLHAQTAEKPTPGFTLEISEWHSGVFSSDTHALFVKVTNTTNEANEIVNCAEMEGSWFNTIVTLDGTALEEIEAVKKIRKKGRAGMCTRMLKLDPIKAGESKKFIMYIDEFYDMTKPGMYEITVTKETYPNQPDKSVTVKSNTLAIVVP
jgi:hypothetical protein